MRLPRPTLGEGGAFVEPGAESPGTWVAVARPPDQGTLTEPAGDVADAPSGFGGRRRGDGRGTGVGRRLRGCLERVGGGGSAGDAPTFAPWRRCRHSKPVLTLRTSAHAFHW